MKIGVLEAGAPPSGLRDRFGRYGAMFEQLLGAEAYEWAAFDVRAGQLPPRPDACDAYLITGSSAGVYDPEPWIAKTEAFLRAARGKAVLVGICFGHQLMAQAFGGRVIKSPKGWGIGLHRYEVRRRLAWMDDAATIASPASHQDQVVEPPPGAIVLAASDFTPFGMLAYDGTAISLQLHPEFDPAYARALIEARRGSRYAEADADDAIASLTTGADERARLGRWIGGFLNV